MTGMFSLLPEHVWLLPLMWLRDILAVHLSSYLGWDTCPLYHFTEVVWQPQCRFEGPMCLTCYNKAGFVKNALLPPSCLNLSVMTNLDYLLPDRECYPCIFGVWPGGHTIVSFYRSRHFIILSRLFLLGAHTFSPFLSTFLAVPLYFAHHNIRNKLSNVTKSTS